MRPTPAPAVPPLGPAFGWLSCSHALTLLAIMVGQVALPWWIAQRGGAHDLAVYGVAVAAMSFVAMPLLSPLADRRSKRGLIAAGLLAYALAAAALAACAGSASYRLGAVLAIATVIVVAMALILPAINSIVTEVVAPASLARALGRQESAQAIGRLAGPAVAGVVMAAVGTAPTLWVHAALLLAAAALAWRLPRPATSPRAPGPRRRWAAELRAGLRAGWAIPIERGWMLVNFAGTVFLMPAFTMLVPLKLQSLGLSARWLGFCEAALALGMLAGSLGVSAAWSRRQGRFAARVTSAIVQGLAFVVAGSARDGRVIVAMFALVGVANSATVLVGKTHRLLARPAAFRARMTAGSMTFMQVAQTLGPALAGLALARWSVGAVYVGFGLLAALAACGFFAIPGLRAFMALEHDAVDHWYGRTHPHVFEDAPASPQNL